jgi:hypothetical protein
MEPEINIILSVAHLSKDSLWRKTIEKAEAENLSPIEICYEISKQRGSEYIYIPSVNHYHSKKWHKNTE